MSNLPGRNMGQVDDIDRVAVLYSLFNSMGPAQLGRQAGIYRQMPPISGGTYSILAEQQGEILISNVECLMEDQRQTCAPGLLIL